MKPSPLFLVAVLLVACICGSGASAAPFAVTSVAEMSPDAQVQWGTISITNGTPVPNGRVVPATANNIQVTVNGGSPSTLSISNLGSGAKLANSGPGGLLIRFSRELQGFGVNIGLQSATNVTYQLDYYNTNDVFLGTVTASGTSGQTAFIGVIDPDARIGSVALGAKNTTNGAANNAIRIADPILQIARPIPAPPTLAVTNSVTYKIYAAPTYLREDSNVLNPSPADTNVIVNEANLNAHDLLAAFPTMRPGDYLRFERLGYSLLGSSTINPVLGVFTSTPVILEPDTFRRLPTAIAAGRSYFTGNVTFGSIAAPTNIPQDFYIGESTFITLPAGARYLFTSLGYPSPQAAPNNVRVSLVPRRAFSEWLASLGLYGANANPGSDLDRDGLTLIQEFAFRKNPTVNDKNTSADFAFASKPSFAFTPGKLTLVFGARTDGPITYSAEFSADLKTWQPAPANTLEAIVPDFNAAAAVFAVPDTGTGSRRFGRIRLQYQPADL